MAESQLDRWIEHFAGCVADSAASGRAAFAKVGFDFGRGSSGRSRSIVAAAAAVVAGPAVVADSVVVDVAAKIAFVVVVHAVGLLVAA